MKYNLIFAVMLVVIMCAGIFAVDISRKYFIDDTMQEITIQKDSIDTGAIYLSSPNEISFDPMGIVDKFVNSVSSEWFQDREIVKAMITNMSGYSDKTKYVSPVSNAIQNDLHKSGNGYIYIEKHRYYNTFGEERLMDCIISADDGFRIVYINFYSEEESNLTTDEINDGINELRIMSEQYYFGLVNNDYLAYNAAIVENFAAYSEKEIFDNVELVEKMDMPIAPIDKIVDVYDVSFSIFDDLFGRYINNPVEYFWKRSFVLSSFYYSNYSDLNDYDGLYQYIYGTIYTNEIIMSSILDHGTGNMKNNTEYVAHNGRIYQTMYIDDGYFYANKIIVIYNISDGIIEGFFAEPR